MHPFVPAILVRGGGLDELGPHPEPEPPDAELGEAAEGAGGKGLPIVGANPLGESVGAEEAPKDLLGRLEQRTFEPVAGQQIARVGILDGERIAVAAIAELELSLEVDRPDGIGPGDRGLGAAGVRAELRAAAMPDAAVSHQDPMNGGNGGHPLGGMGLGQELMEFAGTPAPGFAELEDLANHRGRGGVGAGPGPVGAIGQALGTEPSITVEPLVAGLAADVVAPAELGERRGGVLGIEHETLAQVHG